MRPGVAGSFEPSHYNLHFLVISADRHRSHMAMHDHTISISSSLSDFVESCTDFLAIASSSYSEQCVSVNKTIWLLKNYIKGTLSMLRETKQPPTQDRQICTKNARGCHNEPLTWVTIAFQLNKQQATLQVVEDLFLSLWTIFNAQVLIHTSYFRALTQARASKNLTDRSMFVSQSIVLWVLSCVPSMRHWM